MLEFILTQAEMLALMVAVKTSLIPMLDNERLVPDSPIEQRWQAEQGLERLKERGLLRVEEGRSILNGDLGMMAGALAYPALVTVITRDETGVGPQQFLHYRLDPVNAELTMPDETTYRLAALPDAVAALARTRQILPVTFETAAGEGWVSLNQPVFMRAKELAEAGQPAEAEALLRTNGVPAEAAASLAAVLYRPQLGGTVTYLRVRDQEVGGGQGLAMVQNEEMAWLIRQPTPGEPGLRLKTVNAVEYSTALLDTMSEVAEE